MFVRQPFNSLIPNENITFTSNRTFRELCGRNWASVAMFRMKTPQQRWGWQHEIQRKIICKIESSQHTPPSYTQFHENISASTLMDPNIWSTFLTHCPYKNLKIATKMEHPHAKRLT